jgi:hypothetical protein
VQAKVEISSRKCRGQLLFVKIQLGEGIMVFLGSVDADTEDMNLAFGADVIILHGF